MKEPTERDKQRLIGPSGLANPCDYCLAADLLAAEHDYDDVDPEDKKYWLPAVLGTATHNLLERRAPVDIEAEQRVPVGTLEGYGTITGSSDVYVPKWAQVIDWKTTERAKLKLLQKAFGQKPTEWDTAPLQMTQFTRKKYVGQIMLYGRGWELLGQPVRTCSFVFICRDGKTNEDIWVKDLPYDRAFADKVWARAEKIWLDLQGGRALSLFISKTACWTCVTSGEQRKWSKTPF